MKAACFPFIIPHSSFIIPTMAETKQTDEDLEPGRGGMTQDEQLLKTPRADEFTHTDTWRVFRIMGEFVEGFDDLASVSRGVAIFGSARTPAEDQYYAAE